MTVGQAVAIVAILAQVYGTPQMPCMIHAESDYRVTATNGDHKGAAQYRHPEQGESIWDLLAGMAVRDPAFLHRDYVLAHWTPEDLISAVTVMGWAIKNGYGEWWSTWTMCGGEG